MTEKILARASGRDSVCAGDEVVARPDFVLAYVFSGFARFHKMIKEEFGLVQLDDASRFKIFLDHNIPVTDQRLEARVKEIRQWCEASGVTVHADEGIGHVVAAEEGYATPGRFVVHFDGHISQLGTYGTLAIGVHTRIYEVFATGRISLRVPETVRIEFVGMRGPGVMARDVIQHLIRKFSAGGCNGKVIEFGGEGMRGFSSDELRTLLGLAMFLGATSAIVEPHDSIPISAVLDSHEPEEVFSDSDAIYADKLLCDLSEVELTVAAPPSPANVVLLESVIGQTVNVGYIGSCVSGHITDLRVAASVLRGRKVIDDFILNIVPSSRRIMNQASKEGLLAQIIEAGGVISPPSCSFCYGAVGALRAGQTAISTGTLNIPGRMGSAQANIFLANAAVVAATAIEGRFAHPARYL